MEQELFTTMGIANELEHKSKNLNRDVLNIAKRLGFTPVLEQTRKGKTAGGRPEKLWSREQRDAILADNRNRHKKPAQILSPDDKDTMAEQHAQPLPAVAIRDTCSGVLTVQTAPPVAPAPVVEVVITLADRANRIRQLQADVQRGIIQIGEELIAAKEEVGHGNWSAWLDKEFSWTQRTANNFMRVAERFGKMENVFQFQPSALQAMLLLPAGDEQEFIAAQADQGTPVESQSAREVQKNVKAFKVARTKTKHPTKQTAEEPTPDLSNKGETFSIFGRATELTPDTNPNTDSEVPPAQVDAVWALVDQTDDPQTLRDIRLALKGILAKLDSKLGKLDQKKLSRRRGGDAQETN